MGSVYKRGDVFWIQFYRGGQPYRESSQSRDKETAKRLLKIREGEIAQGKTPSIYFDKVRFEELAKDFLTDYRINRKRSIKKAARSVGYLETFFGGARIVSITPAKVNQYIFRRQADGMGNGSINRELAALKRMFSLGQASGKVATIPKFALLKEAPPRAGFFEYEDFRRVRENLREPLASLTTFAYFSGWRVSELLGLTWDRADLKEGTIRLDPGQSKNQEGRTYYLNEDLKKTLQTLHRQRRLGCPHVFHRDGRQIQWFRGSWLRACKKAGLQGRLFHDFRRTAIRNAVRAGIPEVVAMQISGHKTRAVFERYNIVSPKDLKQAALRQQAYHDREAQTQNRYNSSIEPPAKGRQKSVFS